MSEVRNTLQILEGEGEGPMVRARGALSTSLAVWGVMRGNDT